MALASESQGRSKNSSVYFKRKMSRSLRGKREFVIKAHMQCEYEDFADELMRDQFIAGLTSEALRVKLIGKGHRHRDSQTKVALREVVEAAKSFEATTYAYQLMKTARGN